MRILLDECVHRPLRRELTGHDVRTIREMGWAGKKNGELLVLMAGAGDLTRTTDVLARRLGHGQRGAAPPSSSPSSFGLS